MSVYFLIHDICRALLPAFSSFKTWIQKHWFHVEWESKVGTIDVLS